MRPLVLAALALVACNRPPDPLAPYLATCKQLQADKQLKDGLSLEVCAKDLKATADAADPAVHAADVVTRIEALIKTGKSDQDPAHRMELRDAIIAAQDIGKPAVPALMSKLSSPDADLRIAVAKALVAICAEDCPKEKFDCIVPALLEGTTEGKPSEVRLESIRGLSRCTGKEFGDDPKAWRDWWAAAKK